MTGKGYRTLAFSVRIYILHLLLNLMIDLAVIVGCFIFLKEYLAWLVFMIITAQFHFSPRKETKGRALPVPIPQYVKNRLITVCKDTVFHVRCSLCHKVLISHQAAQAHFKYVSLYLNQ